MDGLAEIRDGRLTCRQCLEQDAAARNAAALAVWKPRLVLLAGCALILGLSLFLVFQGKREQARAKQASIDHERAAMDTFLKHDSLSAAVGKRNELLTTARDFAGTQTGADAAQLAAEAGQKIDAWLTQHYGQLSAQERHIVTRLLSSYPGATASGLLQLQGVHVNGVTLSLRFIGLESDAHSGATRNPAQEEARHLLLNIFDSCDDVQAIDLHWLRSNAAGELTTVRTYSVTRNQYQALTVDGAEPGNLPPLQSLSAHH